jgi:hypothetical protein
MYVMESPLSQKEITSTTDSSKEGLLQKEI